MHPDSENFEPLRRLLALKRHEQPPPRYFNDFSSQVIARIKAGESGEPAGIAWLFSVAPWLRRWLGAIEAKPVLAGAFGAAICGLFIAGIVSLQEMEPSAAQGVGPIISEATPQLANPALVAMNQQWDRAAIVSSTNPVAPSVESLFNQAQLTLRAQQSVVPVNASYIIGPGQ